MVRPTVPAAAWFPVKGPLPEMGFAEDMQIIEMYRNGFEGIPVDPGDGLDK